MNRHQKRTSIKERALTYARLREVLSYDPETGAFTWLAPPVRGQLSPGDPAGTKGGNGYCFISIDKHKYYAHRLAHFYMTGEWPSHNVDHRDGNPLNNRWENIRPATQTQNMRNARRPSHNTSGIKGVCLDKKTGRWRAYIVVGRRQTSLGYHATKEAAAAAYALGAAKIFGEFARLA